MVYVKLDSRTLDSSLWACDPDRIVFLTALMMAEPFALEKPAPQLHASTIAPTGWTVPPGAYGIVRTSGVGIIRRALVDDVLGAAALARLSAADPDSRTTDHDGRRLARVDGGWIVLNFAKYREKDSTAAERMRRYRDRLASAVEAGEPPPPPPFDTDSAFDDVWADVLAVRVPKPLGKKAARSHFGATVTSDADVERLRIALANYRKSDRVTRDGGRFAQNASTWFNNWQDWVSYQEPPGGNGRAGKVRDDDASRMISLGGGLTPPNLAQLFAAIETFRSDHPKRNAPTWDARFKAVFGFAPKDFGDADPVTQSKIADEWSARIGQPQR